jgi:hypothetical protein
MVNVPGLNLADVVAAESRIARVKVSLVNTANFFDEAAHPGTAQGAYMKSGLRITPGADVKVGTWLIVCNRDINTPYSVDNLVSMQFEVYSISAASNTEITMTWVQYVGSTRPLGEEYVPTFTTARPVRGLVVVIGSSLEESIRTSLAKVATSVAGGGQEAGIGKQHYDDYDGKCIYYHDKNKQ